MNFSLKSILRELGFSVRNSSSNRKTVKPENRKTVFTLIELLAAMGVLSIIMFVLLSFFASAQEAWTMSNARAETYENARIALDLIARDLQSVFYVENQIPFWHRANMASTWTGAHGEYFNEALYFVSATSSPPNDVCTSRLCEVAYQLYHYNPAITSTNVNYEGWLRRSVTGNVVVSGGSANPDTRWNFHNNFAVGASGGSLAYTGRAGTEADDSNDTYQRVIPHVVNLTFICMRKDGNVISPDTTGVATTGFPYAVTINLTLLDKTSWDRWKALGGQSHSIYYDHTAASPGLVDNDPQREFRRRNERTFTRTIFIGERGQRYP